MELLNYSRSKMLFFFGRTGSSSLFVGFLWLWCAGFSLQRLLLLGSIGSGAWSQ